MAVWPTDQFPGRAFPSLAPTHSPASSHRFDTTGGPPEDERVEVPVSGPIQVDIHLRLEIPVTNDADVYDKMFEALSRHLRGLVNRAS